jgi:hypothetical protein
LSEQREESVFARADRAGAYQALRLEALRSHPSVLALRNSAALSRSSVNWSQRKAWADAETEPLQFDPEDPDDRAVERMSTAAASDDGYRVQLLDLAALHGGLHERAVNALYRIEVRSLDHWEAEARRLLDWQQIRETRQRDAAS